MTTNIERAKLIAKDVALLSVTLAEAKVTSTLDPLGLPDEIELDNKYRARYEVDAADTRHFRVFMDFMVTGSERRSAEGSDPILALEATFLLIYRVPPNATYPEDCYEHFAWLNGALNAWPYWRELVQSVAGRTGLAGVVIPVFHPPSAAQPSDRVSEKTAATYARRTRKASRAG